LLCSFFASQTHEKQLIDHSEADNSVFERYKEDVDPG
jgi:hypothetical protein